MKVAIMMRAMDQDSGHHAIIEGLVENLLKIEDETEYLLLYRTDKYYGRFSAYPKAQEQLIYAPHKFLWDQCAVPYHAWKEKADLIFNPKFSVPLISHCQVVMGLHEPAWWAWPEHYEWFDRNYMRWMLPIYLRKAKHLFPISQFVIDENRKYLRLPFQNCTVAYPAPKPYFKKIEEETLLNQAKQKYHLPNRFILSVTRVDHPGLDQSTSFFPGKNVEATVRAFMMSREEFDHDLVIAGRRVKEFLYHIGLKESDLKRIHFLDFVPHQELPALLNLADLFVLPSFYESYAMALAEAMSCGCPIVASTTGACPEITGGAALLADPDHPEEFAACYRKVLKNEALKQQLSQQSLERAAFFTWEKSARVVLDKMKEVFR